MFRSDTDRFELMTAARRFTPELILNILPTVNRESTLGIGIYQGSSRTGAGIVAGLNHDGTITYCNLEIILIYQSIIFGKRILYGRVLVFGGHDKFTGVSEKFGVVG